MARFLHKSWQDKRPGFTRRVRWYKGDRDVRLCFDTDRGIYHRFYDDADAAQIDYDRFANGMTIEAIDLLSGGAEPCPDCGKPWDVGDKECPSCGVTIEDVAERMARKG